MRWISLTTSPYVLSSSLKLKARPVHIHANPITANKGPIQAHLRQLAAKFDSCPHNAPLSDIKLLKLYHSFNIHDKIARETAMLEPNLRRLVVLCNMCDAITLRQHQLYLKRLRAHNIAIHSVLLPQVSSDYEKECLKTSDRLPVASRQVSAVSDQQYPP